MAARIKKTWYIYTMESYATINKNKKMSFAATRMDRKTITLSKLVFIVVRTLNMRSTLLTNV